MCRPIRSIDVLNTVGQDWFDRLQAQPQIVSVPWEKSQPIPLQQWPPSNDSFKDVEDVSLSNAITSETVPIKEEMNTTLLYDESAPTVDSVLQEYDAVEIEELINFLDKPDDDSQLILDDNIFDTESMSLLCNMLKDKDVPSYSSVDTALNTMDDLMAVGEMNVYDSLMTNPITEMKEEESLQYSSAPISTSLNMTSVAPLAPLLSEKIIGPKSRRFCRVENCMKRSRSNGLCISHGGGRRCDVEGCEKSSQGGNLCIRHGGGKRCSKEGCMKAAQSNMLCKAHGGGPRCHVEGCERSSQGGGFCRAHGGGKRCLFRGCNKGTQRGDYCALHGGSRLCAVDGCPRNDRGGGLCAAHGGGKRCTAEGCNKPCRRQGLCSYHLRHQNENEGEITQG